MATSPSAAPSRWQPLALVTVLGVMIGWSAGRLLTTRAGTADGVGPRTNQVTDTWEDERNSGEGGSGRLARLTAKSLLAQVRFGERSPGLSYAVSISGLRNYPRREYYLLHDGAEPAIDHLSLSEVRRLLGELEEEPESGPRRFAQVVLSRRWAALVPQEFLAHYAEHPDPILAEALAPAFAELSQDDLAAALTRIQSMQLPSDQREAAIRAAVEEVTDQPPEGALQQLDELGALPTSPNWSILLEKWIDRDPDHAARTIEALRPGQNRRSLLRSVAKKSAEKNPQQAWAWADGLDNVLDRQKALLEVFAVWVKADAATAQAQARYDTDWPEDEIASTRFDLTR